MEKIIRFRHKKSLKKQSLDLDQFLREFLMTFFEEKLSGTGKPATFSAMLCGRISGVLL